jgi:hypothetical protein
MITKSILEEAKAFLCWDTFSDLAIQLVELQSATAYFYPKTNEQSTIIVFYRSLNPDFSKPLFLLFHEAGHFLQFQEWKKNGRELDYWKMVNTATGGLKIKFEEESWDWGKDLIKDFIQKKNMDISILKEYEHFALESIETYR